MLLSKAKVNSCPAFIVALCFKIFLYVTNYKQLKIFMKLKKEKTKRQRIIYNIYKVTWSLS